MGFLDKLANLSRPLGDRSPATSLKQSWPLYFLYLFLFVGSTPSTMKSDKK